MDLNSSNVTHIVVDMLYDFIDGTLACKNAFSAIEKSICYINNNPNQRVLYVCDCHPADHCSFTRNGGTWPPHCIAGTHGQQIHDDFFTKVAEKSLHPGKANIFTKGECSTEEQYSGFDAVNSNGESIGEYLKRINSGNSDSIVVISGIATEFCIMESSLDLLKAGNSLYILTEGLAYVDYQGHMDTLKILKEKGAKLL
ncbi:MAG: isochorismatase family protein [Bacteroidales bacterium]